MLRWMPPIGWPPADAKAVHFKPLINAVLRRIAREGEGVLRGLDGARLNTPDWLWRRWTVQYGEETARAIAVAHHSEAPLDITLKAAPMRCAAERRPVRPVAPGGTSRAHRNLPGFCRRRLVGAGRCRHFAGAAAGRCRGKKVIDLCAAPGGKTMQLAAAGAACHGGGAESTRLERVEENLARTEPDCRPWSQADARDFEGRAHCVLIDAPCTATGTIRRHPDLPWIKGAADVTARAALAYEILESGAGMVEAGGMLVFAVCSLEREEGEEQVEAFLSAHPEFVRAPIARGRNVRPCRMDHRRRRSANPALLSGNGGMDGFYAARFKRE